MHADGAGWKHPLATQYGILAVPTMLLVDKNGKVVSTQARGQALERLLEKLLGPPFCPKGKLTFVDLQPKATWKLTHGVPDAADHNLADFPKGMHVFSGVQYQVGESFVQLGGKSHTDAPLKVDGIAVGAQPGCTSCTASNGSSLMAPRLRSIGSITRTAASK